VLWIRIQSDPNFVTLDCETAVLGSNPAISPAYSGLPVLRRAAIWDGTSLWAVLGGVAQENQNNEVFCSTNSTKTIMKKKKLDPDPNLKAGSRCRSEINKFGSITFVKFLTSKNHIPSYIIHYWRHLWHNRDICI
jgi:hypothetical protein